MATKQRKFAKAKEHFENSASASILESAQALASLPVVDDENKSKKRRLDEDVESTHQEVNDTLLQVNPTMGDNSSAAPNPATVITELDESSDSSDDENDESMNAAMELVSTSAVSAQQSITNNPQIREITDAHRRAVIAAARVSAFHIPSSVAKSTPKSTVVANVRTPREQHAINSKFYYWTDEMVRIACS